jgi:hypothetical protein
MALDKLKFELDFVRGDDGDGFMEITEYDYGFEYKYYDATSDELDQVETLIRCKNIKPKYSLDAATLIVKIGKFTFNFESNSRIRLGDVLNIAESNDIRALKSAYKELVFDFNSLIYDLNHR